MAAFSSLSFVDSAVKMYKNDNGNAVILKVVVKQVNLFRV